MGVDVAELLAQRGMLLESARGPIPNVAELVAGEPIKGSWWGHRAGHEIFAVINELAANPDVARMRLVSGKITLVHRRLWPALIRLASTLPEASLRVVLEEHTPSGAHRKQEYPLAEWVGADVVAAAARLSRDEARAALPECLR